MCHSHHNCRFCHSHRRVLVDCCLTHHCHCSANAFANAATSRCAFASLLSGWLSRGFSLRHNLLMHHRLLTHHLVVVSPFIVPPSHFPQLVVTLPLFAPPLPLNAPTATSWRVIASPHVGASTSLSPFVKNHPPPPAGFSFGQWMPVDEWTKMGALLGFWSGGGERAHFLGFCAVTSDVCVCKQCLFWDQK
jgi:hypothetical protein